MPSAQEQFTSGPTSGDPKQGLGRSQTEDSTISGDGDDDEVRQEQGTLSTVLHEHSKALFHHNFRRGMDINVCKSNAIQSLSLKMYCYSNNTTAVCSCLSKRKQFLIKWVRLWNFLIRINPSSPLPTKQKHEPTIKKTTPKKGRKRTARAAQCIS